MTAEVVELIVVTSLSFLFLLFFVSVVDVAAVLLHVLGEIVGVLTRMQVLSDEICNW
jgi:hypothetical protein